MVLLRVHVAQPCAGTQPGGPRKLASVSASACSLDQRTRAKGRAGRRGRECHQPVAAVLGRTERRVGSAERAEGAGEIGGGHVGDVAADHRHPPARERPAGAVHPAAEIAAALADARHGAGGRKRARSGVTASTVLKRRSAAERAQQPAQRVARWKRSAARSPMPRASRRFTAPSRGARANTTAVSFTSRALRSRRGGTPQDRARGRPGCAPSGAASRRAPTAPAEVDGLGGERHEPRAAEAAHQIHILHQRQRADAADRFEQTAVDQQALVAIGQRQSTAAPGDQALQPAGARVAAVEREAEIAGPSGACPADVRAHRLLPAGRQPRIGMQQQQPVASRGRRAGGELRAAPARGGDRRALPATPARSGVPSVLPPSATTTSSTCAPRAHA